MASHLNYLLRVYVVACLIFIYPAVVLFSNVWVMGPYASIVEQLIPQMLDVLSLDGYIFSKFM